MERMFTGGSEEDVNALLEQFLVMLYGTGKIGKISVLGKTWRGPNGSGKWTLVFSYEVLSSDDPCWTSHPLVR